tara:strand:+ start:154 stop:492 length:339 start_codon:yes stop_codon:yes gene_type:complete
MEVMINWRWPGNIRELENLVERCVLLCEGGEITSDDLHGLAPSGTTTDSSQTLDEMGLKEYVRAHTTKLERARIQSVLETEGGNVTRAAKSLGISRKSLQTKMKDYGLRDQS